MVKTGGNYARRPGSHPWLRGPNTKSIRCCSVPVDRCRRRVAANFVLIRDRRVADRGLVTPFCTASREIPCLTLARDLGQSVRTHFDVKEMLEWVIRGVKRANGYRSGARRVGTLIYHGKSIVWPAERWGPSHAAFAAQLVAI